MVATESGKQDDRSSSAKNVTSKRPDQYHPALKSKRVNTSDLNPSDGNNEMEG